MSYKIEGLITKTKPMVCISLIQVHEVSVDREINPDPVTTQLHDIVCWVFKQSINQGTTLVETVDQILDAQFANIPISPRLENICQRYN